MTRTQSWTPAGYAHHAGFVPDLGAPLLALLAPAEGERILDLGCGDGVLTERLMALNCTVVGVDASPEMVAAAQARGVDARLGDGRTLTFEGEFDAVFSNAALHWMKPPQDVIHGVHRALKPEGRFVAELGGFGNVAAVVTALVGVLERDGREGRSRIPWVFPTAERYRAWLEEAGFTIDLIALVPRPTRLPTGINGWLETFATPFLYDLEPWARAAVMGEVEDLLAPTLRDDLGDWWADYVRLRVLARKTGPAA